MHRKTKTMVTKAPSGLVGYQGYPNDFLATYPGSSLSGDDMPAREQI